MSTDKILLALVVFSWSCLFPQSMWSYKSSTIFSNTPQQDERSNNLNELRDIIIFNDSTITASQYSEAIEYLYLYHRDTDSVFLLNNLHTFIDNSLNNNKLNEQWAKFYYDKYFLGLLGKTEAIQGMDSVANFDNDIDIKLRAIENLAEIGIFNNYDFVKYNFLQSENFKSLNILLQYTNDLRFKAEIISLISSKLRQFDKNDDYVKILFIGHLFSKIQKDSVLNIYNDLFRSTTGLIRHQYFIELGIIDKDGEPDRVLFVLPQETDEYYLEEYIPNPRLAYQGIKSHNYLEPHFIKSLLLICSEINSSILNSRLNSYVKAIKPLSIDSSTSTLELFENLITLSDTVQNYNWLGDLTFSNDLKNILAIAKTNLQNGDSLTCRVQVKAFQDLVDNVYKDSLNSDPRFVTIEGWKFLYWNAQYILDRLPEPPANLNLVVNLKNSLGNQIPASNVKYYEGSWKDAVNNGDGTFTVITTRPTVSIRVFYEYASQQVDNVPAQNNTYTFTTINAVVQLKNSLGNLIDVGTVQYYAGAWRSFGTTSNGVAYKELLPVNYSFRMTYEYGSIDKQQNLSADPIVVFQTVNAAVQLKNSLGNLIDLGTVQYYAGAWRSFGTTSNGVVYKELLPVNYSFRMTYEFVSYDKQQNISTNPVVDFNTVLCSVKVSKTSDNQPINNADVKYYSGAWRNLGTTNSDGITTKELLPANISFRATFGNVSLDKQQDISVNNLVEILLNIP